MKFTENDLDRLIMEKLKECSDLPQVCKYTSTEKGIQKVTNRAKEIIFNDGITDIDAVLAKIEDEMDWSGE